MQILINNNLNKAERHCFAKKVSHLIHQCNTTTNPHKSSELVNVYDRKIEKARKNKIYNKEGILPFLFVINKN